jgi:hypothetical protein
VQTEVEEYPIQKVPIDKLQFDSSNPNKPTKEQIAAIKKSFHRFGYLVPIVVNESYQIGDGEHRALIYKELGIKEIPAYIVPRINDDIERRLLRQTMNKLRGEHEIKLDADEIALIFQSDKLDNLAELIATERESLENILTKHKGGSQFELCWSKNKHWRELIRIKWFGIFGTETQDVKKRIHPTQKPIQLYAWFIQKFTNEGDITLDPFLGSGSTLIACEQTSRICFGCEIDPHYCDVVVKRWESFTSQKAVKLSSNEGGE